MRVLVRVLMRMQVRRIAILRRTGCDFGGRLGWRRKLGGRGRRASGIGGGGGGRREILGAGLGV
jgi:hypothetical protein